MRLRAAEFREVVKDGAFYGQPHSEPVEEGETDARLGIFRGRWVHTNADVKAVLSTAMKTDPSPAVRKKASWLVPGGLFISAPLRRSAELPGGSTRQLEVCLRFTRQ